MKWNSNILMFLRNFIRRALIQGTELLLNMHNWINHCWRLFHLKVGLELQLKVWRGNVNWVVIWGGYVDLHHFIMFCSLWSKKGWGICFYIPLIEKYGSNFFNNWTTYRLPKKYRKCLPKIPRYPGGREDRGQRGLEPPLRCFYILNFFRSRKKNKYTANKKIKQDSYIPEFRSMNHHPGIVCTRFGNLSWSFTR